MDGGPEAIRLQEIAADAGISHPAILHHFGSREGLVEAMVLRGIGRLQAQFLEGWPSAKEPDVEGVLERFYDVASRRGIARMLAWLILSGQSNGTMTPGVFKPAAERMHAGQGAQSAERGTTAARARGNAIRRDSSIYSGARRFFVRPERSASDRARFGR